MAHDAMKESHVDPGELSPRSSPATVRAVQPAIATSFPRFASLPEEIRRLIWQHACLPIKMHFLRFPNHCSLPGVGQLTNPADAPSFGYDGVRDDLAILIRNSENYQNKWGIPGCRKFRSFFWRRDLNLISSVCPEARDVYLNLANQNRLELKKGAVVNESRDIFHFSSHNYQKHETMFLLTMRPRISPINIAIDVGIGVPDANIILAEAGSETHTDLPRWLSKAIEWGREAKEGYDNSPATSLTPSIDDLGINLENLRTIFLLDHGIKLRHHPQDDADDHVPPGRKSIGRTITSSPTPLVHQYNILAHGMEGQFYGLSPEREDVMKNWDVPAYVWPILEKIKKIVCTSDDWKVNIYLMAFISKKTR